MFVIVGLGNPGEQYSRTRHNIGYMAIDKVNERLQGKFKKGRGSFFYSDVRLDDQRVLLVKPTTFMNLSGQAVQQVVAYNRIENYESLLIVLDDFHLPFGTLRLRPSGSAGGQKGLQSILQTLGTTQIARLRIGIGNSFSDATTYVLSPFNRTEQKMLPELLDRAADAIESFVLNGMEITMSRYNTNFLTS